jgi:hypothetical protein
VAVLASLKSEVNRNAAAAAMLTTAPLRSQAAPIRLTIGRSRGLAPLGVSAVALALRAKPGFSL